MRNILTGQIDLTALQNKVWIWIWQLTHFITNNGATAITNYVHYQIVTNIIFIIFLILTWIMLWILLYKNRKWNEIETIMWTVIIWTVLLAFIFITIDGLLGWWLAPEITFIQVFTN